MLHNRELDEARRLYGKANLPFPPLPPEQVSAIRRVENWVYGTRSDAPQLYYLDNYVEEAVEGRVADYVLLGHSGRGINSWAIHYYLVRGPLALFIQVGWGGALREPEGNARAADQLQRLYEQTGNLMSLMEKASTVPGERYILQVSSFYGSQRAHLLPNVSPVWHEAPTERLIPAVADQLAAAR